MRPFQSPAHREKLVVKAARWMWGKRESLTGVGWSPAALTDSNVQDPTNPHFTLHEAEAVFEVLKERELLLPTAVLYEQPGGKKEIGTGYRFNTERLDDWITLIRKRDWFSLWLCPWAEEIWGKKKTAMWAFVYALILAFCVKTVEHIVDTLWKRIFC